MSAVQSYHHAAQRQAAIRQLMDEHDADRQRQVHITVSGDRVTLDGTVERYTDKEAALTAALLVGEADVVTDRITVRRPAFDGMERIDAEHWIRTGQLR